MEIWEVQKQFFIQLLTERGWKYTGCAQGIWLNPDFPQEHYIITAGPEILHGYMLRGNLTLRSIRGQHLLKGPDRKPSTIA